MKQIPSNVFLIGNLFISYIQASTCTLYFSYEKDSKRCYLDLELDDSRFVRGSDIAGMPIHHLRRFFYSEKYETV